MADSTSLSILRQTPLSSSIATKAWTEENFAHLSGQIWYGECSTAAATAAKAVTIPGVTSLVPGMNFRIYFTNNQTYNGAPTLNVNGLGAKNIKRVGTTNAARYEWLAGETLDFVYDDNYFRMIDGGFATTSYYGVTKLASTATTTSDSYAATPGAIFKVVGNTVYGILNTWTKNTQYSVGDKVYNAGKYYECIEANSSATFDATKFREIDNAQTQIDNLSDAIANIDIPEVPTDLSAFTNSPGYLTAHQSLSDLYILSGEVVEGLSNIVIPKLDTISGLVEDEVEKVDEISAKLSSYSLTGHTHTSSDITNFPPIPTNTNQLVNGAGFITSSQVDTKIAALDGAITGSAGAGKTLTSFSQTDGKVTAKFADIAITKSQITDFPTIPTVSNGTLTIQKNGNAIASFSANQSTDVSANISVPTKTSELTNDSGFVVSSDLTKVMEYQGSVETYANLPNDASKGDVYNVVSANGDYPPGTNYAWNGTSWDPLGGSIDVSKFAEVSALNKLSSETVNGLSVVVNPKLSTIADKVEEEVAKLDELSGKLSAYTLTSDFNDLISTITDELSNNINPKLSTIADQVSAETQKVDEISARLDDFALTSDIPSDYLSGVQMNGSLRTVTNKVADLGTVISSHQQLSVQDEYTEWILTPSYIMSVDEYSQDYLGKTIYLKWVEWEPGNPNSSGWQPYVLAGSTIDWCGGFIGNLSSTELVWEEPNWIGEGSLSAKRYKKGAVLGDQTSVDLALADHTHSLSDIANVPGVMQTGSYNDLLDKPTIPLSTSQLTNNSGFIKKTELQSDLSNYLPLSGGTISGDLKIYSNELGTNIFDLRGEYDRMRIGYNSKANASGAGIGAMAIGISALAAGARVLAIGYDSYAGTSTGTGNGNIAIGAKSTALKTQSTAIGRGAYASETYTTAIGSATSATAAYAIQLGRGTNNSVSSLQVYDWQLLDSNGDIPYARLSANIPTLEETDPVFNNWLSSDKIYAGNKASATYSWDIAIGQSAKSAAGIAIGLSASATGSSRTGIQAIAIGDQSVAGSLRSTAIGFLTQASSAHSLALGSEAKALTASAIQLGKGTNSEVSSLQVYDWQLLDSNGNVPEARVSSIGYVKDSNITSKLNNYLPLSGGRVSGDLEVIDGDFLVQQFPSEAGKFAKIDNMGLWINNDNEYVNFYRSGIHYMPSNLAGETMLTFPPYTENGEIVTKPYLSSYLSSNYLLKNEKTIMPIYGPWVGSPLLLSTNIELYQVLDMDGTGTFPVLSAPTNIASFGKCYYCFEIEWITNSAVASFSQQLDWINEPEIQSDGEWHTYYITGRYKSDNGEYTMNCWRVK